MDRDTLRGFGIIIAVAAVATVFFNVSANIAGAILGAISLIFIYACKRIRRTRRQRILRYR